MIEKLVTIPLKATYHVGKAGVKTGAKAGKRFLPRVKRYLAPMTESVEDIDFCSRIEKKWGNKDLKKYLKENPEQKATLEECIEGSVEKNKTARKWASVIDTVDKVTAPIGAAGCYLIFMAGTGYALALAEEAVEMAALKGPFMAYYAAKGNAKRIPGWLAYEALSHVLPFGDALDLRNNYVNSVDKDIQNNAENLFRKRVGLKKKGLLTRFFNRLRKTTTNSKPEPRKLPDPYIPVNRVKEYMDSLKQESYTSFMKEKGNALPEELERFVTWGFDPGKPEKWYSNSREYIKNLKDISQIADKHCGNEDKKYRQIRSAYELNIGNERKWVIEFSNPTQETYREAHNIPPDRFCQQSMVNLVKDYKIIADAATGRIEGSDVKKNYMYMGCLDKFDTPKDSLLETKVPERVALAA